MAVELANSVSGQIDLTDKEYDELVGRLDRFLFVFFKENKQIEDRHVKRSKQYKGIQLKSPNLTKSRA